ncbi:MAG: DUF555 domain-containing protein, partial [Halobacteriales archaeon]
ALNLEMVVFNVEREEHASRIARKEIGERLRDIPLSVLEVEVVEDEEAEESEGVDPEATETTPDEPAQQGEGDELLPDFEELIE